MRYFLLTRATTSTTALLRHLGRTISAPVPWRCAGIFDELPAAMLASDALDGTSIETAIVAEGTLDAPTLSRYSAQAAPRKGAIAARA